MDSPFRIRQYRNYDEYLNHQRSKLEKGIGWLGDYEIFYDKILTNLLKSSKIDFKGKSCLCLGARTGTEVNSFIKLGSFAVGLDVKPSENNKYVVTGDASQIQYPDNSIDIVYTNALDHFFKIKTTLREIKRVLKTNGFFVLLLGVNPEKDKFGSTWWTNDRDVINYICSAELGFKYILRIDVGKTKWFSNFAVMKKR